MADKIFMIGVTDKEGSLNRKYSDGILSLLSTQPPFVDDYTIEIHYRLPGENLHKSLNKALTGDEYEGFIVLLDCLEGSVCNPNVMFEFGAIYYLNKPFVVISSHSSDYFPFDVNDLRIIDIPVEITEYIISCHKENENKRINMQSYFYTGTEHIKERARINSFLCNVHQQYLTVLDKKRNEIAEIIDYRNIMQGINEIKKLISNTAEYIDGEGPAFNALQEAVSHAESSLRTSRFANESIVKEESIEEQKSFMKSLYKMSDKLGGKLERIICNNHPVKWNDIYNILFFGGNGAKVYVRKHDYSIHFEIVVIDEKIAFIHFYQADREKKGGKSGKEVEKIKSTLKIQGSSICQKMANIFDRLHHRDFLNTPPVDPSRTLLGIPVQDSEWREECAEYGCFVVGKDIPAYSEYSNNPERRKGIIKMFKDAFLNWNIGDNDKIIMAAGISLVEGSDRFLEEMKENNRLNNKEFNEARKLYEENQG